MGHYDNCRDGYCGICGAAPGNMINGKCEFCEPEIRTENKDMKKLHKKASKLFEQIEKMEGQNLPEKFVTDLGLILEDLIFWSETQI